MSLLGFALVAAVGSRRRRVEDLYR
jgi:hypothetical protein